MRVSIFAALLVVVLAGCDSTAAPPAEEPPPETEEPTPEPEPEAVLAEGDYRAQWENGGVRFTLSLYGLTTDATGRVSIERANVQADYSGGGTASTAALVAGRQSGPVGDVELEVAVAPANGGAVEFSGTVSDDGETVEGIADGDPVLSPYQFDAGPANATLVRQ